MPIGVGYDQHIGTRPSAVDPNKTEYFNKQTNVGFANAGELAAFASTLKSGQSITPDNVFGVIEQGFTPLDPTAAPTTTAVPELPQPVAPSVTSGFVNTATQDLEAKRKAVEDAYKKELDTIRQEKEAAEKRIAELTAKQEQTIEQDIKPLTEPFQASLEEAERKRLKVEENYFANQKLVEELDSLLMQGNAAIRTIQTSSGVRTIMDRHEAEIISGVAARAGVIQAVMSARNGQIAQAYNLIDRSVQATVADRNDRLNYYNTLLNFYDSQKDDEGNKLVDLTSEERKFVDAQIGLLESDLQNAQATADYIKQLMIDPETAKFIADAGVTLNDSIETINKKMAEQTKRIEVQQKQKANREEAFAAGITTQFYNKGGEIVRTADGFAFENPEQFRQMTGMTLQEAQAKGLIGELSASFLAERQQVLALMNTYHDAGIRPTDSLAQAENKLGNSRIYKEQVRPPVGAGGGGGVGVLGLTNQQIDNISPLVTQFQNSPIVQNYNTIGEGYSFVRSLSNKTTNPADDQALIYALAKALDPGSVVREGEYATVQKYAQSMVQSYGKSVSQALSGKGFLSESARKNIKSTIESRFRAAETSYKNLYGETERRINLIGNTDKGNQLLNNYGGAFAPTSSSDSSVGPVNPDTSITQPATKSFWQKATNWLFGD